MVVARNPVGVRKQGGRPGRRGGTRPFMKKVSKRGAYKKNVKNQLVLRRGAICETKQRVHSDIATINGYLAGADNLVNPLNWRTLVVDDAFTVIPLKSFYRNTHGFQEYNVIGNNIFSKYLNMKMQFRFPKDENIKLKDSEGVSYDVKNKMIEDPTKVYLICGYITESMNYPLVASPSPSLPAQSAAGADAIVTYIEQQLKPFFDDDEDKLQFRPKSTTNIKIEKYVKLAPKLTQAIGTQATPEHQFADSSVNIIDVKAHGSIPDVSKSWSTKTNRKIPLTEGAETSYPVDKQNLFVNNSWIPFAIIYNPSYEFQAANAIVDPATGNFTQVQMMEYRWNDVHYFTDS